MSANKNRLLAWIRKADHDLGSAIIINQYIKEYSDTLAYHCQQATEKYIVCLLEYHSITFKKTHDLRYLLDLLNDVLTIDQDLYEKGLKLNSFGVEVRYPDYEIDLSQGERNEAIEIARLFRNLVRKNININIDIG
ncbi:MAG: HEPN domain-containing protein [Bacteroidales bacterium]|nr:HEPN domain-containing protein [Bacteroidales bacterium]